MIKIYTAIFLSIGLLAASCKQPKVTTANAIKFYDSINYPINLTRPLQQKFLDKIAVCMSQVKEDNMALIDTVELYRDLDSAKISNLFRKKMIKDINEVDRYINYKKKIITNVELLTKYYNNEFDKCIKVLGSNQQNKFESCRTLMVPPLTELKNNLDEIQQAKNDFKTKYKFTASAE